MDTFEVQDTILGARYWKLCRPLRYSNVEAPIPLSTINERAFGTLNHEIWGCGASDRVKAGKVRDFVGIVLSDPAHRIHTRIYVYTYVYVYTHMYTCKHICICVNVCVYIYIHMCIGMYHVNVACIYMYIYTYALTDILVGPSDSGVARSYLASPSRRATGQSRRGSPALGSSVFKLFPWVSLVTCVFPTDFISALH